MKTIFITLFQGVEAKNILRTDVCKTLLGQPEVRLVFLVHNPYKAEYFQKEFNHPRVAYQLISNYQSSWWDKFWQWARFAFIKTETLDLRRCLALAESKNYFRYLISFCLNRLLARSWLRKLMRKLDYLAVRKSVFGNLFEEYKPDLLFSAHLFDDLETALVRQARQKGIPTVGFVNSWDKLTSRGMIRVLPNKLLVFNNLVQQEALIYADMSIKDIIVTGVPQYDRYFQPKLSKREDFFARLGLDSNKRLLIYAPMGRYFSNSDWEIIDLLHSYFEQKLVPDGLAMLARFQPNDFLDEDEIKKRPWLNYDWPGIRFSDKRGVDWDMSFSDLQHLTDTLYYASILVCYATSLSIDAAIFGKPVININFEVKEKQKPSETPTYFYKTAHYVKAGQTGGIRFVNNSQELLSWINKYLENPALDRAGRERLVKEQCWRLDGLAGECIGRLLLEQLL